jgi:hypothetical protein
MASYISIYRAKGKTVKEEVQNEWGVSTHSSKYKTAAAAAAALMSFELLRVA